MIKVVSQTIGVKIGFTCMMLGQVTSPLEKIQLDLHFTSYKRIPPNGPGT